MSGPPVYSFRKKVSDVIPRNGLVAEYLFSGNPNDTSGNGNDGVVNGATLTTDRKSAANSAYSFFGLSGDDIEIVNGSDFDFTTDDKFSISAWTKTTTTAVNQSIVSVWGDGLGTNREITLQNDRIIIYNGVGNSVLNFTNTRNTNWTHNVITIEKGNWKFYVDGNFQNGNSFSIDLTYNSAFPVRIGSLTGTSEQSLTGDIDDVRIYNRVLTPDEVTILFNE